VARRLQYVDDVCTVSVVNAGNAGIAQKKLLRERRKCRRVKMQLVAPEARRKFRRIGMETQRGKILLADAGGT